MPDRHVEKIGSPRGRIALYLEEQEAIDLAEMYGRDDTFYDEIMRAVARAYPSPEEQPGLEIVLRPDERGRLQPAFKITLSEPRGGT